MGGWGFFWVFGIFVIVCLGSELCVLMGARFGALYIVHISRDLLPITLGTYWTEEKCAHLFDVHLHMAGMLGTVPCLFS